MINKNNTIDERYFYKYNLKKTTQNIIYFILLLLVYWINFLGCDSKPTTPVKHYNWTLESGSLLLDNTGAVIDVGYYAVPDLIDIDNDNDLDLFVGEWFGKIWFYRNTGNAKSPEWTFETDFFGEIDIGRSAAPTFVDFDKDGDFDLFIGTNYTVGPAAPQGTLVYYENVGTSDSAEFELVSASFLTVRSMGLSKPVFVDFDKDNDLDLIIGSSETDSIGGHNGLLYFRNNGNSDTPDFTLITTEFLNWGNTSEYPELDFRYVSTSFRDVDNDKDLDAVFGSHNYVFFYRNENNVISGWTKTNITVSILNGYICYSLSPVLGDLDNDGIIDLIVGTGSGTATHPEASGVLYLSYGKLQ